MHESTDTNTNDCSLMIHIFSFKTNYGGSLKNPIFKGFYETKNVFSFLRPY